MSKTHRYTAVAIAGVVLLLAYALLFQLGADPVYTYVREDGVVETLGAAALLLASCFFFLTMLRVRHEPGLAWIALLLLAVAFLFGAGEEISWGQRIFEIETPDSLRELNAQQETNVHNADFLTGATDPDRLFQAFWLLFGVVLPIVAAFSARAKEKLGRLVPILPVWVAVLLIANQVLAELTTILWNSDPGLYAGTVEFAQARFEVTEMMVSLIFAAGSIALYRAAARRRSSESPSEDPDPSGPQPIGT